MGEDKGNLKGSNQLEDENMDQEAEEKNFPSKELVKADNEIHKLLQKRPTRQGIKFDQTPKDYFENETKSKRVLKWTSIKDLFEIYQLDDTETEKSSEVFDRCHYEGLPESTLQEVRQWQFNRRVNRNLTNDRLSTWKCETTTLYLVNKITKQTKTIILPEILRSENFGDVEWQSILREIVEKKSVNRKWFTKKLPPFPQQESYMTVFIRTLISGLKINKILFSVKRGFCCLCARRCTRKVRAENTYDLSRTFDLAGVWWRLNDYQFNKEEKFLESRQKAVEKVRAWLVHIEKV